MVHDRKFSSLVALIVALGCTAGHPLLAQSGESIVRVQEPFEPVVLRYGEHTEGGRIDAATDQDLYWFEARAGDRPLIVLRNLTAGLSVGLELKDPLLNSLATSSCGAGCCDGCTTSLTPSSALGVAGIYTLVVRNAALSGVGDYVLSIYSGPGGDLPLQLYYGQPITDAIAPVTDRDAYTFFAIAGNSYQINFAGSSAAFNPRMDVFDPTGAVIAQGGCDAGCCSACSFSVTTQLAPALLTGFYRLVVFDAGENNVGGYQITVQCSAPPPFPCIDPSTVSCTGLQSPAIGTVSPPVWTPNGGYRARITGSGFCAGTPNPVLLGAAVPPRLRILNSTSLEFDVPSGLPIGPITLTVVTPHGVATQTIEVRPAALFVEGPTCASNEPFRRIVLHSNVPSSPVFAIVDVLPGSLPIPGCTTNSQLAWSPSLFVISDPWSIFGGGVAANASASDGSWKFTFPLFCAFGGGTVYLEAFVLTSGAPCGFRQSNLAPFSF